MPRSVLFAVLGILYWTAHSMLRPLVGTAVIAYGGSASVAGLTLAVFSVVPTLAAVLVGGLTDRWGGRRLLVLGSAFMVGGGAVLLVPTIPAVVVSQIVVGLGTLCCWVSLQTLATSPLSEDEQRESRHRRIATFSLFVAVGQSVGPALGGLLHDVGGYPLAFAAFAGLAAVLLVASLATSADPPPRTSSASSDAASRGGAVGGRRPLLRSYPDALALLRQPVVVVAVGTSFTALVIHDIRSAWQPILLTQAGVPQWSVGLVLSAGAVAGFAARPFFAPLLRWLGAQRMVALVTVVAAASMTAIVADPGSLGLAITMNVVGGFAVGFSQPLTLTLLADEVPVQRLGLASGLRSTGNQAALLVSPATFGVVSAIAGLSAAFVTVGSLAAVLGALGGVALGLAGRRARRARLSGQTPMTSDA